MGEWGVYWRESKQCAVGEGGEYTVVRQRVGGCTIGETKVSKVLLVRQHLDFCLFHCLTSS